MKKILCLVFAITSFNVFAQAREKGTIELTPQIGYVTSYFNGEGARSEDSRSSVRFGVTGDYFFNDRWSLRSGIIYNSMGGDDGFTEIATNYINIPLNANWHFGSTRKWNLNFGFTPSFLAGADINGIDADNAFKSFQFALTYGIGYKLELTEKFSLLFDLQGFTGLTDIIADSDVNIESVSGSLNIGAVFKL